MANLQELQDERDLYIKTRTSLQNAIQKADFLKEKVLKTSTLINEGVKTGGKGFDEGKMEEYSQKIGDISLKLKPIVDYCTTQIEKLEELLNTGVYRQTGYIDKGRSSSSFDSVNSKRNLTMNNNRD